MIQRIQTIYFLLAALAGGALFALPVATTQAAVAESSLFADAIFEAKENMLIAGALGVAIAALLLAIFMFKNRKLQVLLGLVATLCTGLVIGSGLTLLLKDPAVGQMALSAGVALPLVMVVLTLLANRAVKSDEKLVRSSDRLR